MRLIIEPDYSSLSNWAANYVAKKINAANPTAERPFVLGLPTGSSPQGMYANLVKAVKEGSGIIQECSDFQYGRIRRLAGISS